MTKTACSSLLAPYTIMRDPFRSAAALELTAAADHNTLDYSDNLAIDFATLGFDSHHAWQVRAPRAVVALAWRIPAASINEQIRRWIIRLLGDRSQLVDLLTAHTSGADLNRGLASAALLRSL